MGNALPNVLRDLNCRDTGMRSCCALTMHYSCPTLFLLRQGLCCIATPVFFSCLGVVRALQYAGSCRVEHAWSGPGLGAGAEEAGL